MPRHVFHILPLFDYFSIFYNSNRLVGEKRELRSIVLVFFFISGYFLWDFFGISFWIFFATYISDSRTITLCDFLSNFQKIRLKTVLNPEIPPYCYTFFDIFITVRELPGVTRTYFLISWIFFSSVIFCFGFLGTFLLGFLLLFSCVTPRNFLLEIFIHRFSCISSVLFPGFLGHFLVFRFFLGFLRKFDWFFFLGFSGIFFFRTFFLGYVFSGVVFRGFLGTFL